MNEKEYLDILRKYGKTLPDAYYLHGFEYYFKYGKSGFSHERLAEVYSFDTLIALLESLDININKLKILATSLGKELYD